MLLGFVVVVSPLALAGLFSLFRGVGMFDEASGAGAVLWLLIFTAPLGALLMLIGGLLAIVKRLRRVQ